MNGATEAGRGEASEQPTPDDAGPEGFRRRATARTQHHRSDAQKEALMVGVLLTIACFCLLALLIGLKLTLIVVVISSLVLLAVRYVSP